MLLQAHSLTEHVNLYLPKMKKKVCFKAPIPLLCGLCSAPYLYQKNLLCHWRWWEEGSLSNTQPGSRSLASCSSRLQTRVLLTGVNMQCSAVVWFHKVVHSFQIKQYTVSCLFISLIGSRGLRKWETRLVGRSAESFIKKCNLSQAFNHTAGVVIHTLQEIMPCGLIFLSYCATLQSLPTFIQKQTLPSTARFTL